MTTKEIPQEEWSAFFDTFSRTHKGWLATVEVLGAEFGAQTEVRSLPFEGIGADLKAGEKRIELTLGGDPNASITRGIADPGAVYVKQNDAGAEDTLEIQATDGTVTLVRFHTAGA